MSIKSPSGSTFPYYYKGGELHALKYGGYHDDEQRLLAVIRAEEDFIRGRPAQRLRVWVDLCETELTATLAQLLAEHLKRLECQLFKLALVGCPLAAKRRVQAALGRQDGGFTVPLQFFSDPEDAKTWLVGNQ